MKKIPQLRGYFLEAPGVTRTNNPPGRNLLFSENRFVVIESDLGLFRRITNSGNQPVITP